MAKCFILTSMNGVLQQQHEGMKHCSEVILSMDELFTNRIRNSKREAITTFMNLKMKLRQLIKENMMKVIAHLNTTKLQGAKINVETKIDMIVNLVPDVFDQFYLEYTLKKNKVYTLIGLMQDV